MNILNQQIFENKEAAALPGLLESGGLPALVSGLSGVHRVNLAAALFERLEMPMFVICPDESTAESFARDFEAMTGERARLLFSRDFTFYPSVAASRQAEQSRIGVLDALSRGECRVAVATVSALMQRCIPPRTLRRAAFTVSDGGECPPDELETALLRCGYTKTAQVEGAGQYARRGGILDFFSPMYPEPVRIEFWGDDVDSMGFFDTATQRRTEAVSECCILPAAEALVSLATGGGQAIIGAVEAMAERCGRRKNSEQLRLLENTLRQDAEKLRQGIRLEDADRYLPLLYEPSFGTDYIPADALVFMDQPVRCADRAKGYIKQLGEDVSALNAKGMLAATADSFRISWDDLTKRLADFPVYMADAFTVGRYPLEPRSLASIPAKQLPSYAGSAKTAAEDVELYLKQGFRVVVLAGDMRRAQVLQSFFKDNGIRALLYERLEKMPGSGECFITVGAMSAGMEYPNLKLAVISDSQLIRVRGGRTKKSGKTAPDRQRISSYADLSPGDYVVHEVHGIGRFAGIHKMKVDGFEKDYIKICYAGTDTLYVPATQLDMVTKYLGGGEDSKVKLSKMGGAEWTKTRSRAKASAKKLAKELIALYAERARTPGYAFSPDTPWQREFEDNFGYTETDDQLRSINEIKADMEAPAPMDRLLCGDVGYGKTEVALRAAMKCILDGKQAAILVPTTVLAQQHYATAAARFRAFPVTVEVLSRFRSPRQVKDILERTRDGRIDLLIGTHKLLQKSVAFKDLGLLIIDEEQRFGVTHKERLKEMSRQVDVLTLSAPPITRTLNMALSGLRDMSTIEEPPADRQPVQTYVLEHDWAILEDAMRKELSRGGQVYYLHNRVESIDMTASRIQKILGPEVRIVTGHGKMSEQELSEVWRRLMEHEIDILVCTTIIETGVDVPNANTLIIDNADRMGLSQLHQLRGRVGRSTRRAYAYFTFTRGKVLSEISQKRLSAIREFTEFGSGFKIAMRDLEIRGAGNILGGEQHGHMESVGYDMYLKLLNEAVALMKGETPEEPVEECVVDMQVQAHIPESYIDSTALRLEVYRRIADIKSYEDSSDVVDELIDRFGEPPESVYGLIDIALLRNRATSLGITEVKQQANAILLYKDKFDMERVKRLIQGMPNKVMLSAGSRPYISVSLAGKQPLDVLEDALKILCGDENNG